MDKRRAAFFAIALVLTLSGAAAKPTVFETYRSALAARSTPANMEFEYTVTRSGPNRIITEQHRVFWSSSGVERNDTIAVNGTTLVPPRSLMLHRATWPYDVGQFAVSTDEYDVAPAGITQVANRKAYAFTLTRPAQADFMLKALYVDAIKRMPLRVTFVVTGSDCQGSGAIDFLPAGVYWLPTFISVICTGIAQGAAPIPVFKEAIRFSGYRFPTSIPPDVFGEAASDSSSSTRSDAGGLNSAGP